MVTRDPRTDPINIAAINRNLSTTLTPLLIMECSWPNCYRKLSLTPIDPDAFRDWVEDGVAELRDCANRTTCVIDHQDKLPIISAVYLKRCSLIARTELLVAASLLLERAIAVQEDPEMVTDVRRSGLEKNQPFPVVDARFDIVVNRVDGSMPGSHLDRRAFRKHCRPLKRSASRDAG
jgi:hypothetical protein